MAQVVIVGAGPTGATLALLLIRRGIQVKLIEASRNFRRAFRGEALMPTGLDALQQMGLSTLLDRLPHRPLSGWEFVINNRSLFRVQEPLEANGQPCTLVSQPALLAALIEQAQTYAEFEFVPETPVQDVLWAGQRVSGVKLGSDRELFADLVIAADGRSSSLRQKANLLLEQRSPGFNLLWFKLADHPQFERQNIFYSILKNHHAFGVFRSAEGHLQVGWFLHNKASDWKQIDWSETLAAASPAWLADHFRAAATTIERPVLLTVTIGRCSQWWLPGLLLLGDAAHPMSPIRAQGINMALRDVIVAMNYLVPQFNQGTAAIDAVLPKIQAEREPEIIRIQQLQNQELAQARLLENSALLRWGVSQFSPVVRLPIRELWLQRQRSLRQGVTAVQLRV